MEYLRSLDANPLPHEIEHALRSELRDGERMIWMGQPDSVQFAKKGWPIILFGIPFTIIPLIVMSGFVTFFGLFSLIFFIPFLAIGGGMLSAPYWLKRAAKRSGYAITNRRAIIRQGTFRGIDVRSYSPEQLKTMRRIERNSGNGDLIFEDQVQIRRDSDGDLRRNITEHGFIAIANVREVEELLRKTLLPEN